MSDILSLEKNKYGFVDYARIQGENGHVHDYSYRNPCACMVCGTCEQHAKIDGKGNVSYPFSHCWCGWKCGPSERAEFAAEFEDFEA